MKTLLITDANHLYRGRLGKPLRMTGHEQQAPARIEFHYVGLMVFVRQVIPHQQTVPGQVMAERQNMDAVVQPQLARGMHKHFVAERVERRAEAGRSDNAAAPGQHTGFGVFKHEEVALLAAENNALSHGCFGCAKDFSQTLATGDVDRDGDVDLVAGELTQPNRVYLGAGNANLKVTVDGVTSKLITLDDASFTSGAELATALQNALNLTKETVIITEVIPKRFLFHLLLSKLGLSFKENIRLLE